jgi:hypothetical protein
MHSSTENPTMPSSSQLVDGKKVSWILALKELKSKFVVHDKNETNLGYSKDKEGNQSIFCGHASDELIFGILDAMGLQYLWFLAGTKCPSVSSRLYGHHGAAFLLSQSIIWQSFWGSAHSCRQFVFFQLSEQIVILGSSLAAGVGTVDVFENNQEEDLLVNNHQTDNGPGPVLLKVLAQALSQHTGNPSTVDLELSLVGI